MHLGLYFLNYCSRRGVRGWCIWVCLSSTIAPGEEYEGSAFGSVCPQLLLPKRSTRVVHLGLYFLDYCSRRGERGWCIWVCLSSTIAPGEEYDGSAFGYVCPQLLLQVGVRGWCIWVCLSVCPQLLLPERSTRVVHLGLSVLNYCSRRGVRG